MEDYGCIIKSRSLHKAGRYIFDVHYNTQPPLLRNQPHCQMYLVPDSNHAPTVTFQMYTPKTLPPFDGKDGGQILLAIDDIVFDVTQGAGFMNQCARGGILWGLKPFRGYVWQLCGPGRLSGHGEAVF